MTVHVSIQVRGIQATDYNDAKGVAYGEIQATSVRDTLFGIGVYNVHMFWDRCRVARECDGTFTVTIP